MASRPFLYALALLAVLNVARVAVAGETTPGPITARVVSVYDGDTLTVDAAPWPGMTIRIKVRLATIDTPEINGPLERRAAGGGNGHNPGTLPVSPNSRRRRGHTNP